MSAKLGMSCKIVGSKSLFYTALFTSVVLFLILSQNTKPYITQTSEDIGYKCMSSDICVFSPYFQSTSHSPKKSERKKRSKKQPETTKQQIRYRNQYLSKRGINVISRVFSRLVLDWLGPSGELHNQIMSCCQHKFSGVY